VAIYASDTATYQKCVEKAKTYLLETQITETNDPSVKSDLLIQQAKVAACYSSLVETERLLIEAKKLIGSSDD